MRNKYVILAALVLLLSVGGVRAQDENSDEDAESTIRLMGEAEAERPEAVTKEIRLPASLAEDSKAVEAAVRGRDKAQERHERREEGLTRADKAREHGANMAEEARENRENRGRSEDRPEPPNRPGPPNN